MKLSPVLCRQHLERMARRHWFIKGKKVIAQTKAEECVKNAGHEVIDGVETFVKTSRPRDVVNKDLLLYYKVPEGENPPDYKIEPYFIYEDNDALLGGIKQVQVLTNTLIANEPAPAALESLENGIKIPTNVHEQLKSRILLSCVFDAEQKKLPKRKDPARPAFTFPRDYGITDERKIDLLCQHLTALCEQSLASRDISCIRNSKFSFPVEAHGKQMQFEVTAEALFTSRKQLSPYGPQKFNEPLPDIQPLHCTVSIKKKHFYEVRDIYPVIGNNSWPHVHTALLHHDSTKVRNLYDAEVTDEQKSARLMLKAFCIAACEARALNQGVVSDPITVQAVQTDGQNFQFGVFQLNTLDLENSTDRKNIFWLSPSLELYSQCAVVDGKPLLEGYNPAVLQKLMSFVSNR